MKLKISPTSPKVNEKHRQQIDQLYNNELKSIERPSRGKPFNVLGVILLTVFVAFITGLLGIIVFLSYGSEIPFLDRLDLFSYPIKPSLVISGSTKNTIFSTDQVSSLVRDVKPSLVSIFKAKEISEDLESAYLTTESLGSGFILTNDGYIITGQEVTGDEDNIVVATEDGKIYSVEKIISDPATNFSILKINASDLTTVTFADPGNIRFTEDILLLKSNVREDPLVLKSSVLSPNFTTADSIQDFVHTSELYYKYILLSDNMLSNFKFSIAYTLDKQVLGMVINDNDQYVVTPFTYLTPILDDILSEKKLSRPYIGIRYVNIAEMVDLPVNLTQKLPEGALIYSPDEENKPSIVPGSPAQKAGLEKGDIIIELNGSEVNGKNDLSSLLLNHQAGEIVSLSFSRASIVKEVKIHLENNE